uniref:RAB6-interacting golgin n=1 Tax=Noccaea caerulescens TaxID=107243 RepID=A0A1J3J3D3_NOCCA
MMASDPKLKAEIGPDGLAREAPVIAYTEKIIEEEQLQLRKYIEENYSKIRDVEREFGNLTMEMKLTAGPKKAALEHLRKKIEACTEKIHAAKLKEDEARKAYEAASKVVKDEEAVKQRLCEDLNSLVQESSNTQYARLEELKRRLEALNPNRSSTSVQQVHEPETKSVVDSSPAANANQTHPEKQESNNGEHGQKTATAEGESKAKKKPQIQGKGRGLGIMNKGRGGWTGSGFDVDGRN